MKRMLVLFAAVIAIFAVAIPAASASPKRHAVAPSDHWSLTLARTGSTFSGTLTNNGEQGVGNQTITLRRYAGATCAGTAQATTTTTTSNAHAHKGNYSKTWALPTAVGTYSFQAEATGHGTGQEALSSCISLVVASEGDGGGGGGGGGGGDGGGDVTPPVVLVAPQAPMGVFLCYSKFGTETLPAVFTVDVAWNLVGYFSPVALPGNVVGGDNVGAYHLVCNPGSQYKSAGFSTDDSGNAYDAWGIAAYTTYWQTNLGLYPVYK